MYMCNVTFIAWILFCITHSMFTFLYFFIEMYYEVSFGWNKYVWAVYIIKINACVREWKQHPVQCCNDDYVNRVVDAAVWLPFSLFPDEPLKNRCLLQSAVSLGLQFIVHILPTRAFLRFHGREGVWDRASQYISPFTSLCTIIVEKCLYLCVYRGGLLNNGNNLSNIQGLSFE